jgi:hypothetical protein
MVYVGDELLEPFHITALQAILCDTVSFHGSSPVVASGCNHSMHAEIVDGEYVRAHVPILRPGQFQELAEAQT